MRKKTLFLLHVFLVNAIYAQTDWANWGNTQQCIPQKIFYPTTQAEVQIIIQEATDNHVKFKAVGSSHSWSDLVCTDGYLINTDYLNRIIWIDSEKHQVKVEAGIKIRDLIEFLAAHNLALSNQGFITDQSIAGAIATATHGTGKGAYALSDYIMGMEILDAQGILHEISEQSHPEWLPLTRVALGALGFVYSVTIQCEPLFNLVHKRTLMNLSTVMNMYQELYERNDFFMFMMQPQSSSALVFFWNRTNRPSNTGFLHYFSNDCVFNRFLNYFTICALSRFTEASPFCISTGFRALQMNEHVEHSYISLSPIKTPLSVNWYIEQEIAINFDDFPQALADLKKIYEKYDLNAHNLISIITCRFGPTSQCSYLNPAYGRKTAYITINIMNFFKDYELFFQDCEKAMIPYNGRSHWGKFNFLNQEKIAQVYDRNHLTAFNNLRKFLDPHGLFENDFVQRCFGHI